MNLKVTLIQADLYWEDVAKNLAEFSEKIAAVSTATDILVLPEMFNTGFSMDSEKLAETMDGKTVTWMKEQAQKTDAVIVGSLIIKEDSLLEGRLRGVMYYNRLIWAQPNGEVQTYDKRHLFRMADEHEHFSAGKERLIVSYKGWRICPMICYDLRFPVWSRNKQLSVDSCQLIENKQQNSDVYDILIYIANWPAARKQPWSKLLEARAIENQCYVLGVNRVGEDGKGIAYSGNSVAVNPKGEITSVISENEVCSETVNLSLNELTNFREAFPVSMDGDEFEITH